VNYSELTDAIQEITENTFSATQLALFVRQAEQKIYNTVQIPALRRNVTGFSTQGNQYLQIPGDFLYTYSIAVMHPTEGYKYMLNKDVNFIREAFPYPVVTGIPSHYAYFDDKCFIMGPTPDAAYEIELHYGYYPESIVTAGTTWLGDEFDSALLNGSLLEANRFMKGSPDITAMYEKEYGQSIMLLKVLGDGKLRQDAYRSGQFRMGVT
jgi:hypothetical protein